MTSNAIILSPDTQLARTKSMLQIIKRMRSEVLVEGQDYGVIPGTSKPTLYQPGAEKLMVSLNMRPMLTALDKDLNHETGFFFYRYRAEIIDLTTGNIVADAIGSCNSFEKKYRYRWVEAHELEPGTDITQLMTQESIAEEFVFSYEKRETSGKYGKPESYWQQFDKAIADKKVEHGTKKTSKGNDLPTYRIRSIKYRVLNPDIYDQLNTIDKMAQKRALVSAVKQAANASEYFTVDMEDMPDFEEYLRNNPITVTKPAPDSLPVQNEVEEAEVVDDPEDKIKSYPDPDEAVRASMTKEERKNYRMGQSPQVGDDTPQHPAWLNDAGKREIVTNHAIAKGLGDNAKDAWEYLKTTLEPGRVIEKRTDITLGFQDTMKRITEIGDELAKEVGATDTFKWTDESRAELQHWFDMALDMPAEMVDGIYDEPTIESAMNKALDEAAANEWDVRVQRATYTTSKQIIFEVVPSYDVKEMKLFGGRSGLTKLVGDEVAQELGVPDWQQGETYDVNLILRIEADSTKGGYEYFKVATATATATDDQPKPEGDPSAEDIPF